MHLLICDDDARFAARVEQAARDYLAQREIPVEMTVCTSGEEVLRCRGWTCIRWRCWMWTSTP